MISWQQFLISFALRKVQVNFWIYKIYLRNINYPNPIYGKNNLTK